MRDLLERTLHMAMAIGIALLLSVYVGRPIYEFIAGPKKTKTPQIERLEPAEARQLEDPDGPYELGPERTHPEWPGYSIRELVPRPATSKD